MPSDIFGTSGSFGASGSTNTKNTLGNKKGVRKLPNSTRAVGGYKMGAGPPPKTGKRLI